MTKLRFIEANGTEHVVHAIDGQSVMQAATADNIPGIIAECGGYLSCSTCHGYIDEDWLAKVAPPSDDEQAMIECTLAPRPNSRLTCQVPISSELDGMIVRLPESQL